jgi:chloramphenicol-sensitive protein RarD
VLGERLRRLQFVARGFGAAAVAVLAVAYGRVPWIALVLACSFGGYGFLKKAVPVGAVTSLAVETLFLLPPAVAGLVVLEITGEAAFLRGSAGRDVLLVSLGVVTAVPLVLFGTAARRIPLSLLGLLQYLTPTLQLLCGVVVFHEPMPAERLIGFVLVWVALAVLAVDALGTRRRTPPPLPVVEPT